MAEKKNKRSADSLPLIYSLIKNSLELQNTQKNTLETKSSTIIAFAAGLFALLMGASDVIASLNSSSHFLILISVILLAVSVILATMVGWVRSYRSDPEPSSLAENYLDLPEKDTMLQIIANWLGTWKSNKAILERNAIILKIAFLTQTIGFILLGTALFLSIL